MLCRGQTKEGAALMELLAVANDALAGRCAGSTGV